MPKISPGCQIVPHPELGYLLFYIGYRDIHTACICAAYSADGVTDFHRCKLNPLVKKAVINKTLIEQDF